ncbi:MAG: SMI1/KNR4 family protein [Oscillospiraceae bacterium]
MLTLGKYKFTLDEGSPENRLYLCTDENGKKAWNIELHFAEGEYGGETVCPTIILGYIKTEKQTPAELKNESFKVGSIEECEEREDEFYIFEHEPMFKYNVKIVDFRDGKALVCCSGTAVEDGYSEKPKKVKFTLEEWVTVGEMSVNEDFSDDEDEQTPAPVDGKTVGFIANGGANPDDLEISEQLAGFTFPEDLRKFLLEKNGAVPETKENHIILPTVKEKLGVRFLYGLTQISGTDASHFIPKELKDRRLFIPEQMVPVAGEKRGLCWICYSNMEKYKGVYAVDRMLKLKESKRDSCIYKIADTFTEFLTKIVADE